MRKKPEIAILIPCFNEAVAIAGVVADFRAALPEATVYVYDNNSQDGTAAIAAAAGAVVRNERMQGKGSVVCRMFADVEADVYLLVDGDGTYDAAQARSLVDLLLDGHYDMINGRRIATGVDNYRRGHRVGNAVLTGMVRHVFQRGFSDMLSGYKVFSRRYVKSFPALSKGFEIETQLTVHALTMRMAVAEVDTRYGSRPSGSDSKLETWRDGWRILRTIIRLVRSERPMELFFGIAGVLGLAALVLFWPIAQEYLQTGLVPRFPTLIGVTAIMICALLSVMTGIILESVALTKNEARRLRYLSFPAPGVPSGEVATP